MLDEMPEDRRDADEQQERRTSKRMTTLSVVQGGTGRTASRLEQKPPPFVPEVCRSSP